MAAASGEMIVLPGQPTAASGQLDLELRYATARSERYPADVTRQTRVRIALSSRYPFQPPTADGADADLAPERLRRPARHLPRHELAADRGPRPVRAAHRAPAHVRLAAGEHGSRRPIAPPPSGTSARDGSIRRRSRPTARCSRLPQRAAARRAWAGETRASATIGCRGPARDAPHAAPAAPAAAAACAARAAARRSRRSPDALDRAGAAAPAAVARCAGRIVRRRWPRCSLLPVTGCWSAWLRRPAQRSCSISLTTPRNAAACCSARSTRRSAPSPAAAWCTLPRPWRQRTASAPACRCACRAPCGRPRAAACGPQEMIVGWYHSHPGSRRVLQLDRPADAARVLPARLQRRLGGGPAAPRVAVVRRRGLRAAGAGLLRVGRRRAPRSRAARRRSRRSGRSSRSRRSSSSASPGCSV